MTDKQQAAGDAMARYLETLQLCYQHQRQTTLTAWCIEYIQQLITDWEQAKEQA